MKKPENAHKPFDTLMAFLVKDLATRPDVEL